MATLSSLCLGVGLSAACGFRVFVPLFIMSLASLTGHLTFSSGFDWIGTYPALATFAAATGLEIAGYYVPWVDNLLDTIATPAAIIAGTIVTASVVSGMSPLLQWSLAVIAGGGTAGVVQAMTTMTRGASSLATGGFGNPVVSTVEMGGSVVFSVLAVAWPVVAGMGVLGVIVYAGNKLFAKRA
ncbi:MAG: DUF4126 domain-containing protein [Candidatus Tectimicrobiota bacterium]